MVKLIMIPAHLQNKPKMGTASVASCTSAPTLTLQWNSAALFLKVSSKTGAHVQFPYFPSTYMFNKQMQYKDVQRHE